MNRVTPQRTAIVALAAITAVTALAAPANAEREVLRDTTSDVWSPEGPGAFSEEGSVVNTDIKRTTIRHQDRFIVVKVRYVELKKRASDEVTFYGYLRTDRRRTYEVVIEADWLGRGADYILRKYSTGTPVDCDRIHGRTRFGVEVLRVSIPRSCLGKPRWVRFRGAGESYKEDEGRFLDSAIGSGARLKVWSQRIHR